MFSGKQAENAAEKLDKGMLLFAEGPTIDESWEDRHKQKRVTKHVKVELYRIVSKDESVNMDYCDNPMDKTEENDFFNGVPL